MEPKRQFRCAIYTRKSSEEGLEQDFNSLHAQREACEAYIASQAGEGWRQINTHYDDGGYSGGNMDRPALRQLLGDIAAGKVDVIVVYKVDRLTRSLSDFAKIVDIFDQRGVSFVSVTQSFNTTTSMGRLTLNVLLSFAQFEREVTGERIRDKIAASRKKGIWMGGFPPLGYDVKERKLIVNEGEATSVRMVFSRYLELRSVTSLAEDLGKKKIRSKQWTTGTGRLVGGAQFKRGPLYHLLRNKVYIGESTHKGQSYPGQHAPILDLDIWNLVQSLLTENATHYADKVEASDQESFLKGLLYDDRGNRMSPSYTSKARGRYRYYVSQALLHARKEDAGSLARVAATRIEATVDHLFLESTREPTRTAYREADSLTKRRLLDKHVARVSVSSKELRLCFAEDGGRVVDQIACSRMGAVHTDEGGGTVVSISIGAWCRGAKPFVDITASQTTPRAGNATLKKALARAWRWRELLATGQARSIAAVARAEKLEESYVKKLIKLAFLPPRIMIKIMDGAVAEQLTLNEILALPGSLVWDNTNSAETFSH